MFVQRPTCQASVWDRVWFMDLRAVKFSIPGILALSYEGLRFPVFRLLYLRFSVLSFLTLSDSALLYIILYIVMSLQNISQQLRHDIPVPPFCLHYFSFFIHLLNNLLLKILIYMGSSQESM